MDIIKKELERFAKRDLAVRKAIAKRRDRLEARHRTLRVIEQATGMNQTKDGGGKNTNEADTKGFSKNEHQSYDAN